MDDGVEKGCFMFEHIEIIGFFATLLSCVASVPQAVKIIKTKDASAVSTETYLILIASYMSWATYAYYTGSISLLVASLLTLATSSTVLALKFLFWKRAHVKSAVLVFKTPHRAVQPISAIERVHVAQVSNQIQ